MNLKNAIIKTQFLCIFIFSHFFCGNAFGQKDNINIIPLSPNAAEMTKYGEIPVSNFTGIPDIRIPVYTITSGELSIPIALSYHAGGNKVESIASWVGLSWSLGSFPSISRSVNGQPDESISGFFNKIGGKSVREHYESMSMGNRTGMENLLQVIRDSQGDSEPDAFYLNINGKSGRFYYDQDKQSFVTATPMNVKIEYSSIGFTITADDGTIYYLEDKELTGTSATGPMSAVVTTWQITKILSPDRKDEINFTYATENQMTSSLISDVRYQILSGNYCSDLPSQSGGQLTSISAKLLSSISFNGGRVDFIRQQTGREDLNGGFALDKITVYNNANALIKEFGFVYKYLSGSTNGSGCSVNNPYLTNKWMFLTQFRENRSNGNEAIIHSMEYNESYMPACRNSPAQDYWGYYNGAITNQNLIPPIPVPDNPTLIIPGADRSVNPYYTAWGMLNKLTYPTGGYTLFEYENNDSHDAALPSTYATETAYLAADDPDEVLTSYKEYETTFVINNPPDAHLNGGNTLGGAYVNADIQNLGVPFGNTGALIYIEKISSDPPYAQVYPGGSFQNYYLPNGTYRLKAVFNQNPPNYQSFFCIITFDKIDNAVINQYTGGLRIKKIRSFDSISAIPITKNYSYVDEREGTHSSGKSFIHPVFKFYDVFTMDNFGAAGGFNCSAKVLRARSYSNQVQVTHGGSYVGYQKVFVYSNDIDSTGMTAYEYNHLQDADYGFFPYAPAQSKESFRGQPIIIEEFKKKSGVFIKVKQSLFEYKDVIFDDESIFGIKTNAEVMAPDFLQRYPYYFPYEILKTWSALSKKTEKIFDSSDETKFTESIVEYSYDEPRYQPLETKIHLSDGTIQVIKNYYPYSLSLGGEAEIARVWMMAKNVISKVLKQETSIENVISRTKVFNFKNFDGQFMVMPAEISEKIGTSQDPKITFFDKYNTAGKLTEFHIGSGPKTTYLWGYGALYPVAQILNVDYNTAVQFVDLNILDNLNLTDTQLRTELQKLRDGLPTAQITTYTYKPLVGMTSSTDAKGMTTYYEYDAFQRLKAIKGQNGNILKQTDYHYKN